MNNIHPTAIIGKNVKLGNNNTIGPFCILEGNITIGDNNTFISNCIVRNNVKIGNENRFYEFCSIGNLSQDKTATENTEGLIIEIGNKNVFRESCTVHLPTFKTNKITKIENNCLLMVNTHIAHDCHIHNNVICANNVAVAGHVVIYENSIIGGNSGIHQHLVIGAFAMVGGLSKITKNVFPYQMIVADPSGLEISMNKVGIMRNHTKEDYEEIKDIFKILCSDSILFDEKITNILNFNYKNIMIKNNFAQFINEYKKIERFYIKQSN